MIPAYIALGSNLGHPLSQLRTALASLAALPHTELQSVSSGWRSAAVGPGEQPDYLNAVAMITTELAPDALLQALQHIEAAQGRERTEHWGPRTLDLDILLYGDLVISTAQLTVPHPRMGERNFVLYPLREISNTNLLPNGMKIDALLRECPANGLEKTALPLRDAHFPDNR